MDELLVSLRAVVGERFVRVDPDVIAANVVDWTGRFRGHTAAVVAPGSVAEVAGVLGVCREAGVAVVPQGGNSGLVGGSVPLHGEIVVDLRRLDELEPVDALAGQVTAQAGVTIARLQQHALSAGWLYGVDLGARDIATVGGTVATNAGGIHVLRYGPTRRQLTGIEAVFSNGAVVSRLDGLEKDNTGYDIAGLLCGSEGTLAIVTAARFRLHPPPTHVVVALCGFATVDDAIAAAGTLRRTLPSVNALEFFLPNGLDLVCKQLGLAAPFRETHGSYLLVEAAANADPTDDMSEAINACAGLGDVAVATDAAAARALWRYREGHTEAINLLGAPHKLDVALPADSFAAFVAEVPARVRAVAPDARVWLFGHAGDGNAHVNVTDVAPANDEAVSAAVFGFVAEHRGSISAEHGIGTAKRGYLALVRSKSEIAAYRAIKAALDPTDTLNPHVLLPE